ncbi:MAG: hypothetical protein WBW48_24170 [Anaerolineae bacterium]
MTAPNLDFICAEYGRRIGDDKTIEPELLERLANKAIGVLQGNGVYALMLYLSSRGSTEQTAAEKIKATLKKLWYDRRLAICTPPERDEFETAQQLAQNLDKLLLVKNLCEQTLIYARYHAKARG